MVKSYKSVDIASTFQFSNDDLAREGSVYVSTLPETVAITTNAVTLESTIDDSTKFVTLGVSHALRDFFLDVERAAVAHCIANKERWFKGGEGIEEHLKSFVDGDRVKVRVKVDELDCFDVNKCLADPPLPGASVKALLETSKITFGKTEFGIIWTLRQIRLADSCQIPDAVSEEACDFGLKHDLEGVDDSIE
jgi:hypothetical protein